MWVRATHLDKRVTSYGMIYSRISRAQTNLYLFIYPGLSEQTARYGKSPAWFKVLAFDTLSGRRFVVFAVPLNLLPFSTGDPQDWDSTPRAVGVLLLASWNLKLLSDSHQMD